MPNTENIISDLYRNQQNEELSYYDFYESLYQYYLNPLDLNSSSPEELKSLYILNDVEIETILNQFELYGSCVVVYVLHFILDFI